MWNQYRETVMGQMATLEQATMALLEGALEEDARRDAQREAHTLTGSLGTIGIPEGFRLALEMEHILAAEAELGQSEARRLSELVVALRREVERGPVDRRAAQPLSPDEHPLLLVIDHDSAAAEQVAAEAADQGMRVEIATDLLAARALIARETPAVVVFDVVFPEGTADSLALLADLSERSPPVPVLIYTASDALIDRVQVARRGGRTFLRKPLPPAQVADGATQLLQQSRTVETKILVVDDDPLSLAQLRAVLEPQGFDVTTLDDPLRFWDTLEESSPDLLVLDVKMPDLNGVELCQVIRNDPRWKWLPVLFLTGYDDPDTMHRVFTAGADDFISKPVAGRELLGRIANRLERARVLRSNTETDPLTGLANRRKSIQSMGQLLSLADRRGHAACFAILDIDHFREVNDRHGHAAGDRVLRRFGELLRRIFRNEDVLSRWGEDEFAVGMYGTTRNVGVHRVAELLEFLRQETFSAPGDAKFCVTFSAGVAEYPVDGTDLQALCRAAEQALGQARMTGHDRVLPAGWHPDEGQRLQDVDLVLVDDDEALAGVLLHALRTRGYRAHWVKDGQTAVDTLGGRDPALRTQVILLNVNLPSLDGLSVLRRLSRDGVLRRSRVIVLTARSGESEELAALELGACDHVAKPLSVPVLMQRIRKVMEE